MGVISYPLFAIPENYTFKRSSLSEQTIKWLNIYNFLKDSNKEVYTLNDFLMECGPIKLMGYIDDEMMDHWTKFFKEISNDSSTQLELHFLCEDQDAYTFVFKNNEVKLCILDKYDKNHEKYYDVDEYWEDGYCCDCTELDQELYKQDCINKKIKLKIVR